MELKSKRLRIIPLTIEQMALLCQSREKLETVLGLVSNEFIEIRDEHLNTAYDEMRRSCEAHPRDYLWYTNWQIILKDENKSIGSIGFMGPANERHETEIGYGIDEAYRNQGYAAEALQKMCEWAFSQENVYYIQAKIESDPINIPSKKVLVKCGFIKTGSEEEKAELLFELEKPKSSFVSIYMCLGLSIGMYIGTSFDNIAIGMCIGISIGVALGAALDESDKNKRKRN